MSLDIKRWNSPAGPLYHLGPATEATGASGCDVVLSYEEEAAAGMLGVGRIGRDSWSCAGRIGRARSGSAYWEKLMPSANVPTLLCYAPSRNSSQGDSTFRWRTLLALTELTGTGAPERLWLDARSLPLRNLLDRFFVEQFAGIEGAPPTKLATEAGKAFLRLLPSAIPMPKAAPDGEGGISFVWDQGPSLSVVGIDADGRLHLSARIGSVDARYVPDLEFSQQSLPHDVLDALLV